MWMNCAAPTTRKTINFLIIYVFLGVHTNWVLSSLTKSLRSITMSFSFVMLLNCIKFFCPAKCIHYLFTPRRADCLTNHILFILFDVFSILRLVGNTLKIQTKAIWVRKTCHPHTVAYKGSTCLNAARHQFTVDC